MKSCLSKNQSIFLLVFILVLGSFILANPVQASWFGDAVAQLIGWIVYAFVYVIGLLIMLVMWVLIKLAQYNDFINATPVQFGWTIVRDVCNMFFILILLIIAFATILRVERYSFKTLLPKLILMAVLINFSKLICGVFIDFAQVIMLTFVNGFKDIGTGNLTNMLGIDKIMSIDSSTTAEDDGAVTAWSIVGAYMLALMYSVIALITLVTMLAVLAMRIIMIWVYVVLSPMAYLLSAFPDGKKDASQWWEEFSKNLIVGPILAFFIWLSFVSLGGVTSPGDHDPVNQVMLAGKTLEKADATGMTNITASTTGPSAAITEAGSPDHMIKFIISIAMLIGGLQISQQLGGQAGGMAGKGMAKLQKMGSGAMKSVGTGLKRATGVERVQMAYKSYKDMKASERTVRARDDAGWANRKIGGIKEGASNVVQKTSSGIVRGVDFRGNRKIKEAEETKKRIETNTNEQLEGVNEDRTKLTSEKMENQEAIDKIDNSRAAEKATKIKEIESHRRKVGFGSNSEEVDKQLAIFNNDFDKETSKRKKPLEDKKAGFSDRATKLEEKEGSIKAGAKIRIEEQDKKITKVKAHQEKATKWVNRGLGAVVGGAAGALTGNPILVAAGVVGGGMAKEKLEKSGKANLKRAANYNTQKISTKKEELKNAGKEKIMEVIKNSSDHHEHAAAVTIALEKGHFSNINEAKAEAQKVRDRFKNDDRVNTSMDDAATTKYPSTAKPYATLENNSATATEKSEAHSQIVSSFENGHSEIKSLDNNAINIAIEAIAEGLKDVTFQGQYDKSSDAQKNTVKLALRNKIGEVEGSAKTDDDHKKVYNLKKKLAHVDSFNLNHFGKSSDMSDPQQKRNRDQKKEFLGSMKKDDLLKSITNNSSNKQLLQEIKVNLDASGVKINQSTDLKEITKQLNKVMPNAGFAIPNKDADNIARSVQDYTTNLSA